MYADIIVDISAENLDKTYQYLIPESLEGVIKPGSPVIIPFGKGNRRIEGYVVSISDSPRFDPEKIKPVLGLCEKKTNIDQRLIELAWWIKEQCGSTMNAALHAVIPVSKKVKEIIIRTIYPNTSVEILTAYRNEAVKKHYYARERFFDELLENGKVDYSLATRSMHIGNDFIDRCVREKLIRIDNENSYRNPAFAYTTGKTVKKELNKEQQLVADDIIDDLKNGVRKDYLIHGITGSGKTEVYMAVIDEVISEGKQVIMLIPEIALTYQTVKRFCQRYGERISIMNSRLSFGERYDQYLRARRGETDIVIGPRSALFTPFERIGLIIMDEEHEGSYISENAPAYSTREVALKRAEMENASVILGSATPSLEAYSMAKAGRLKLYTLDKRANGAELPTVYIEDMREELKARNRSIFSRRLAFLIEDRLSKGEQIILFLNRRGYSGFVSCRNCGYVVKCPHCDVSLTLHKDGSLVCHYCSYTEKKLDKCPKCDSPYIAAFGIGTQKIEEELNKRFPRARILRMDADTTKTKDSYEKLLSAFSDGEADILVGTQMIVKGHDFPRVTLVGALLADLSLYASDFRSGEKTFQLLSQASGRAGRGSVKGEAVIQTYNPEHYSIKAAANNDFEGFYNEEITFRRLMKYPPTQVLLTVMVLSKNEETVKTLADKLKDFINNRKNAVFLKDMRLLGPNSAPVAKINDVYRMVIYIKNEDSAELVTLKNTIVSEFDGLQNDEAAIQFTFN